MSKELKSCAHCGRELSEFCEDFYKVNRSGNDHWVYLRCLNCGAMTQGHGNTKEAAEQNARKRWNTRAERTCTMTKLEPPLLLEGWWSCSECGPVFPPCNDEIAVWVLQQCPHCGAKVVE